MPITKVTFAFEQGKYGWTESYFLNTASANFTAENAKANDLAYKRSTLLGAQGSLFAYRMSEVGLPRRTKLRIIGSVGYTGNPSYPSDAPDTALLFQRVDTTLRRSSRGFIRGLFDEVVTSGGQYTPNTAFSAAISGFYGELIAKEWGWLGKDFTLSPKTNIQQMTVDALNHVNFQLLDPIFIGVSIGTRVSVRVSGALGAASVNGAQVCEVTGNDTCKMVRRVPIFPYLGAGKLTWNKPLFVAIASLSSERIVERKAGRPLLVSRGRSPVKKLA